MPIQLRPSDVMQEAAGALGKWSDTFGQILSSEYEKQRVKEINAGLVILEEGFQKQLEDYPTRGFEIQPGVDISGVAGHPTRVPPGVIAPQTKRLGELQASDVLAEFHKSVKAQQDHINTTVRNKKAREALLQNLAMGAIQQQARLLGLWRRAAQANAVAGLENVAETVMKNKEYSAETKLAMIKVQTDAMVAANWIDAAEAGKYLAQKREEAQFVEAHNGTTGAMEEGGRDAAEKWLKENTPYWDSNPELRQKVLDDTWRAVENKRNIQAMEQDTRFSDIYVKADTVELIEAALGELRSNTLMRGTQKHTWETWLQDKLARAKKAELGVTPKDAVSALFSRLYGAIDGHRNPGLEVSIKEIDGIKDPEDHQALLAKRNELQKSYESGLGSTKEDILLIGYDIVYHPNMSVIAKQKWVDEHVKAGGGLSAEDGQKLRSWITSYNDNPDRKSAMDSITTAYRLSMALPNLSPQKKKDLELELYNARNAMEALFLSPKTTKTDIDRAVEQFLSDEAISDIRSLIIETAGEPVTKFATGEWRGKYREATAQEYLREQGKLTGEAAAQYPQGLRERAEQLEQDALKKAGIRIEFNARLSSGDLVYSAKPIAKGATGKLLMSDTGAQGTLYQVRYQVKNGTYIPTVYRQDPKTGMFDIIEWEWK